MGFHFAFATRKIAALLEKVVVSGISGAAVGGMAGNPLAGAAGAVFNQVAGVIGNDVPGFLLISRCGTFDLARRLNRDLRNIPSMPELLGSILTRTEIAALGLAQAQGRCPFTWRRDAGCGAQWFRAGGRPLGQFPGAQLTVCRLAGRWPLRVRRTRPECILACRLAIMNALCDSVRSDPLLKNL